MGRKDTGRGTMEISRHAILIANGPIKLSFRNVSYSVKDKQILKNVTGYLLPGHTHYIMGASGAGKTTLLNSLAARVALGGNKKL
jgi:ABC-type molybdenum transport system ATPase subunit/photorepair protein PhrA